MPGLQAGGLHINMDNTIVDLASALAFVNPALLMAPEKLKEGIRGALTFLVHDRHGSRV